LYAIFGGKEAMIESPLLNELIAEKMQAALCPDLESFRQELGG
jgi:hypothetical protein